MRRMTYLYSAVLWLMLPGRFELTFRVNLLPPVTFVLSMARLKRSYVFAAMLQHTVTLCDCREGLHVRPWRRRCG
jgi:hypothetical protein